MSVQINYLCGREGDMTGTDPEWRELGSNDQCVKVRSLLRFPYGIAPKNTSGDIPGNDVQ